MVNATPRPFYPRELPATQWAPGTVWTGEGNLATTGFDPLVGESLYQLRYVRLTQEFAVTTN